MSVTRELRLLITAEAAECYCQGVERSARSTAHALGALVAVETFIANLAPPDQKVGSAYESVRRILRGHIDRLQRSLVADSSQKLAAALRGQNLQSVAQIHATLSRSGFRDAVGTAARALARQERRSAEEWASQWCGAARRRAEEASGYPEAFDFPKAGIDPAHYAALSDLEKFLSEQVVLE